MFIKAGDNNKVIIEDGALGRCIVSKSEVSEMVQELEELL